VYSVIFGTDKKWITKMSERSITKKMLAKLRENRDRQAKEAAEQFVVEEKENENFLTKSKVLMEEAVKLNKKKVLTEAESENESDDDHKKFFELRPDTPQFGDVRTSQEETLRKTVGENISLEKGALKYYPDSDDMTLEGKINSLNMSFQFRYNDPTGTDGLYIWTEALQLTESNTKTLGKLRNAFLNWRDSITQDGDLMSKLNKAANKKD
jgi:hypothetical protein